MARGAGRRLALRRTRRVRLRRHPRCQRLPTAFTATIGSGPLHVGICAEYDALPGLGHACEHNIIAAAAIGAARALAPGADDLGLSVTVLGAPAEEGGGGKIVMLKRGAFDGLHAAMIHPGPVDVARAEPFAVGHQHIRCRGQGRPRGHLPELGVNAADAFTVAQVAIGLLRQQLPPSARVHGVVTSAGEAPTRSPNTPRAAGAYGPRRSPDSMRSNRGCVDASRPARWPPAANWTSVPRARGIHSSATTARCSTCSWPTAAALAAPMATLGRPAG